jgi:hypothetical protein
LRNVERDPRVAVAVSELIISIENLHTVGW